MMLTNYFKIALRNLQKNKIYAGINIIGLAIGIGACILLFLIIQFETSFDNFHAKKNNIYRVATEFHNGDGISYSGGVALPVAEALRIDFPEIKEVGCIFKFGESQITYQPNSKEEEKKLTETNIYYAEPEFFKIFSFGWLAGDPFTALKNPNSVVLTQGTAEKYFGNWKEAIGKTIKQDNKYSYQITGIINDIPANSDFPLSIVVSYATLNNSNFKRNINDWVSTFSEHYCFINLPSTISKDHFNLALRSFSRKHKPAEYSKDAYVLQPLSEIHYDKRFGNFNYHTISHSLLSALIIIGIFLILIASVNYINLSTAQALTRSKEVGVRKVLGSFRRQIALQFLVETSIISFISVFAGIAITQLTLPYLNQLLETQIKLTILSNPALALFLLTIFLFVTIVSGLYPSIVLSGFKPISALKSKITNQEIGGISLRRVLVVIQFTIAHILIIGMLIVVSQMDFFKYATLGFDKSAIINVPIPSDSVSHTKLDYLRNRLLQNPEIKNVSFSFSSPSSNGNWNSDFKFDHNTKNTNFSSNLKWADVDYFTTYNLQFIAGRPYKASDTVREFVINETLIRKLGLTHPEDAIGKQINFWDGGAKGSIVGVIKDFNSYSLREPMAPVVLSTWKDVYQTINIKIKPEKERNTLDYIEKIWKEEYPSYVYQYQFLDKTIANFYKQENQLSQLYKIFGAIAILISCLGLYGLVSFMTIQRTREVGIRKVLGATASNIIYLLSKEFTILIIIAFLIAAPVAYVIMHQWLQNYTYRIPLKASIFLAGITGSIIISWLTVGYRTIKTATANPVKSLRADS